ncbi:MULTISPECIES: hypothetical protein [unclassified Bradyrhizobium]|uniref:hypothetical protein n=1 Tax=unclassified Bradyrhizobium TaxID=2631580 RepID=UPI0024785C2B|nr:MULTISPECIES: hypothetical protein [unclassified Bradyrhizobium]WGS19247.1 hypothetical protein MTX22_33240 [Bradyrhizobium sp. ISRA463]WGS26083.1 hypothetical protein MTX19_30760 [Bradyrhizobium sp. ISRA464]
MLGVVVIGALCYFDERDRMPRQAESVARVLPRPALREAVRQRGVRAVLGEQSLCERTISAIIGIELVDVLLELAARVDRALAAEALLDQAKETSCTIDMSPFSFTLCRSKSSTTWSRPAPLP